MTQLIGAFNANRELDWHAARPSMLHRFAAWEQTTYRKIIAQ